ncbi:protein UL92 [macacine betaherpesvirus 9]|uniref:Protein UL92 n=1 Tax=macacine betaherpesvirus 9 TaxID=2560568 RepID=A0A191S3W2_9BETA|nr:protein UL92 [macacine betaherpesvirus 9]ANC96583.1 protein UL92 [macacine betaherpesvirus 9]
MNTKTENNLNEDNCDTECSHMYNLHNPLTFELGLGNLFVCSNCYKVHFCNMLEDCNLINTHEGCVCVKTGLFYDGWISSYSQICREPLEEPNIETINVVVVLLSYVYSFLIQNRDRYSSIIRNIIKDGKFIEQVENAVFCTFNNVFKNSSLNKLPLTTVSQLFVQLIIGGHAENTIYDNNVIRVSKRKKEDNILKKMRVEYGNALIM